MSIPAFDLRSTNTFSVKGMSITTHGVGMKQLVLSPNVQGAPGLGATKTQTDLVWLNISMQVYQSQIARFSTDNPQWCTDSTLR